MTSFRLVQKIGQGSYSRVYKAVNEDTQKILAVKIISFKDAPRDYIQSREIKILRECNHPNIAPLLDYIISQNSIYLVFEYFQMNLNQYYRYYKNLYNKNLDEAQIKNIMIQICSAISYLHGKGIMHRDIKPQNVMINPITQQIKLIDFGFSKYVNNLPCTGYMVTRWYRPLQIVLGLPYDQKIDVFAAGAVFLQLIHGNQIFQSQSNNDQLNKLLNICGFPEAQSKQAKALQKLNILNTFNASVNNQLQSFTKNINDSTKEILLSMLNNTSQKRPNIEKVLLHLIQIPAPTQIRFERDNSYLSRKRRTHSVSNGLTLVSLAFNSREKSKGKDEKQIKSKAAGNRQRANSRNQFWGDLCKVME